MPSVFIMAFPTSPFKRSFEIGTSYSYIELFCYTQVARSWLTPTAEKALVKIAFKKSFTSWNNLLQHKLDVVADMELVTDAWIFQNVTLLG